MKKLNTNQLKYIALFFMFLDSAFFAFSGFLPSWIHLITRFVAPLFAFFTVEGFYHTRNREKYMARLWTAAVLMQFGNIISFIMLGQRYQIIDNIFLTLALGFTVIYFLQKGRSDKKFIYNILGIFLFLFMIIFSFFPIVIGTYFIGLEGGVQILFTMISFWAFYGNRKKQVITFLILNMLYISLFLPLSPSEYPSLALWFDDFCYNSDGLTFLFLPFIFLYNGKKGSKAPIHKWFFYIFYPLQFWILNVLAFFLKIKG